MHAAPFGAAIVHQFHALSFWLGLITAWYLLRPSARVLFGIDPMQRFTWRKVFVYVMCSLWIASLVAGLIALIV